MRFARYDFQSQHITKNLNKEKAHVVEREPIIGKTYFSYLPNGKTYALAICYDENEYEGKVDALIYKSIATYLESEANKYFRLYGSVSKYGVTRRSYIKSAKCPKEKTK